NDVSPESAMELFQGVLEKGYRIAISGAMPTALSGLGERATVIGLDVVNFTPELLTRQIAELRRYKGRLLAINVDTYDDLVFCTNLGFDLYTGRFLTRSASAGDEIPTNRLALLRVLAKIQQPDLEMCELERLVSQDVSLSFKLL